MTQLSSILSSEPTEMDVECFRPSGFEGDYNSLKEWVYQHEFAQLERTAAHRVRSAREAMLEAAKLTCQQCKAGIAVFVDDKSVIRHGQLGSRCMSPEIMQVVIDFDALHANGDAKENLTAAQSGGEGA